MESSLAPLTLSPKSRRRREERALDPVTSVFYTPRKVQFNVVGHRWPRSRGSQTGRIVCDIGYAVKCKFGLTICFVVFTVRSLSQFCAMCRQYVLFPTMSYAQKLRSSVRY